MKTPHEKKHIFIEIDLRDKINVLFFYVDVTFGWRFSTMFDATEISYPLNPRSPSRKF